MLGEALRPIALAQALGDDAHVLQRLNPSQPTAAAPRAPVWPRKEQSTLTRQGSLRVATEHQKLWPAVRSSVAGVSV